MATEKADFIEQQSRVLLEASDWVCRAKAADALATWFCRDGVAPSERARAEEVFRVVRLDADIEVRRILAEGLARSPSVSRETVLLFAGDRAEVAARLIECSPVFDDADLLDIVRNESPAHRLAVARRSRLAATVARCILASGDAQSIDTLTRNPGADIPEADREAQSAA
jgi:uncharacterized protein (DUF2336 family)